MRVGFFLLEWSCICNFLQYLCDKGVCKHRNISLYMILLIENLAKVTKYLCSQDQVSLMVRAILLKYNSCKMQWYISNGEPPLYSTCCWIKKRELVHNGEWATVSLEVFEFLGVKHHGSQDLGCNFRISTCPAPVVLKPQRDPSSRRVSDCRSRLQYYFCG